MLPPASVIAATEARYNFVQTLKDANARFSQAIQQLNIVPRDQPSDVDGPLGLATTHVTEGAQLLEKALMSNATSVTNARLHVKNALNDSLASARLLWHFDNSGWGDGNADSSSALLDASTQLVASAQRSLNAALNPA